MNENADRVEGMKTAGRRIWAYVATGVGIGLVCLLSRFSLWRSSAEFHTVMEAVATTLAIVVAATAPFRYYSQKDSKYLFIGTGFFATALLDGYHTVVTSMTFRDFYPSPHESLITWSWLIGRTFLAALMLVSWWVS